MEDFLTFREWLKKTFRIDLCTRWTIKIVVFMLGGIFFMAFGLAYIPIVVFGFYGLLITVPSVPPFLLYWIYRLERLFTIDFDKAIQEDW